MAETHENNPEPDLNALADHHLNWAKGTLEEQGSFLPQAVILRPDTVEVCGLVIDSDASRTKCQEWVRRKAREAPCRAVVLVMDTWWTRAKPVPGQPLPAPEDRLPPAQSPDRREAITVTVFTPGKTLFRLAPYRREGDKIRWDETAPDPDGYVGVESPWNPWRGVS